MSSIKQNKITPFRSQPHSNKNSRQSSSQKLPVHYSLSKNYNINTRQSAFPNPYLKKFNLRKINRTEQSSKKKFSQQAQKIENESDIIHKLNDTTQLKKNAKFNGIRMHTQKLRSKTNEVLKQSPYKLKNVHLKTIDHQEILTQNKFKHLTPFEKQEIHRYEVLYVGKRRINSIKDFTDSNGDARVAAADAIIYRYEVIDILGKGSFGQVFKAYDHKRKEIVALKIIRNQPKFCTQAKVQIKILEHVLMKDPWGKCNIIQMKHAFFFRGHPCLVFELLHQNLYEFLREFKFSGISVDLIVRFAIQILQGMSFLKKNNIVHCDLKPENILLRHKNKTGIKIIDIGSGCYENEQIYTYIQSRFYRAPQIILGIPYSTAIDMWSLGCILIELYQGYPVFPGQDEFDQIAMFMQYIGIPPPEFIQKGARSKKFFIQFKPKLKANKKGIIRKPGSKKISSIIDKEYPQFTNFIQKCFRWNPDQRMTPDQALLHPWVINSLPDEIKKQHIHQVQKQLQEL